MSRVAQSSIPPEGGRRSFRRDINRAGTIVAVLVAVDVAVSVLLWNRYVTRSGRPPYWGGVAGHLVFWNSLAVASVSLSGVAYLKGHHRFGWVRQYLAYLVVSLIIGYLADEFLPDDFSPTEDAPWLLVLAIPFAVWVWSVLSAPLVFIVVIVLATIRVIQPAKPESWWQTAYQDGASR